jgi:hypothetical protein
MPTHKGCADCKTVAPEILISTYIPGDTMGLALCEACREQRQAQKEDTHGHHDAPTGQ